MPNKIKWTFGLLCGLALFGIQIFGFYRSIQSASWQSTTGHVVTSTTSGTGRARRAIIEYEYSVGREKYSSQTVGWAGLSLPSAERNKFPRGTTVQVYYNPKNPTDAVLEREFPLTAYLVMLLGIGICLAFGWPLFCRGNRRDADTQSRTPATLTT